jgi:streptomycin 3"-adenylyltransferase
MTAENEIIQQQIEETLALLQDVFGENLLGFYVYGSLLLGGLQKYSDLDLLAITSRETTRQEKEKIAKALLKISGIYAVSKELKPIELTIVVKSQINPWRYPPSFDFLYGDWMRQDFESGNVEPWHTKELPNLALVITQLLLSNKIAFGPDPSVLLDPVPYDDFMRAITQEIDSILKDIEWDTRNVLLTLARIWSTVETDLIRSKTDAADWTIDKLPKKYEPILVRAKLILLDQQRESWEDLKTEIRPCADFIVEQIKKRMNAISELGNTNKSIKIGYFSREETMNRVRELINSFGVR